MKFILNSKQKEIISFIDVPINTGFSYAGEYFIKVNKNDVLVVKNLIQLDASPIIKWSFVNRDTSHLTLIDELFDVELIFKEK